jgi:hypothetical protein
VATRANVDACANHVACFDNKLKASVTVFDVCFA